MSERLLAGEALTMEEFASMLEHGGLTDVQPAEEKGNEAKEKREPAMRKAAPRRGKRHRSPLGEVNPCPPWLGFQVCAVGLQQRRRQSSDPSLQARDG